MEARAGGGEAELLAGELDHGGDEVGDRGRVGAAAERDDEAAGPALAQVVEQAEGEGAGELLVLLVAGLGPLVGLAGRRDDEVGGGQRGLGADDGAEAVVDGGGEGGAAVAHAHVVDVDHGGGEINVVEAEAGALGEQLAA